MDKTSTVTLNNGIPLPVLGFGVFQVEPGHSTYDSVRNALEIGYRHVDTATFYRNESDVGRAVRDSGLPREEIFVTSKVWNDSQGRDRTLRSFDASMDALGFETLDLFLVHWPVTGQFVETWKTLVELYNEGRVRAVGVSNFQPHHLRTIIDETAVVPSVNQVELHPYLPQAAVRESCREHGVVIEAWSPIARGGVVGDETLGKIGAAHGKTAAQVTLRWHIQNGFVVLPRSIRRERIRENSELFDFELSADEMAAIDALDRGEAGRVGPHPDTFV